MKADSVHDVAVIVRSRRHELGLTQASLAERIGVSRKWVHELEAGKTTAELGLVLRALHALDLEIDIRVPGAARPPSAGKVDLDDLLSRYGEDG